MRMDESWEIRSGFERRCCVLCLCIWSFRSLGLGRVYICICHGVSEKV
jgi:hypothetical protein